MKRQSIPFIALILFLFISYIPTVKGTSETPRQVVEEFQASLLAVMQKAKSLGVKGRYAQLVPVIERAFDLSLMARISIGSYWNQTTRDQRTNLVSAFKRMSISTLATMVTGYSGEHFETIDEGPSQQSVYSVKTRIVDPDGSHVAITYIAKRYSNGWFLVDVVVDDGISELEVRRSEYRLLLENKGIDGLIRALNAKADQLMSQ